MEIEKYYDYYWSNFKGIAFKSSSEQGFYHRLPQAVQDKLYKDYLFTDFLELFEKKYFKIPKVVTSSFLKEKHFYNWDDQMFREFMHEVLFMLEPRHEHKFT